MTINAAIVLTSMATVCTWILCFACLFALAGRRRAQRDDIGLRVLVAARRQYRHDQQIEELKKDIEKMRGELREMAENNNKKGKGQV